MCIYYVIKNSTNFHVSEFPQKQSVNSRICVNNYYTISLSSSVRACVDSHAKHCFCAG